MRHYNNTIDQVKYVADKTVKMRKNNTAIVSQEKKVLSLNSQLVLIHWESNHGEAYTRIIFHSNYAATDGNKIMIKPAT